VEVIAREVTFADEVVEYLRKVGIKLDVAVKPMGSLKLSLNGDRGQKACSLMNSLISRAGRKSLFTLDSNLLVEATAADEESVIICRG